MLTFHTYSIDIISEAEYTFQLKKPIIPLMLQRYYKPDGWLGMLCGAKLYINFDGKYEFEYAVNKLYRELNRELQPPKDEVDGGKEKFWILHSFLLDMNL